MGLFLFVTKLEQNYKKKLKGKIIESCIFNFSSWCVVHINVLHTPCKVRVKCI